MADTVVEQLLMRAHRVARSEALIALISLLILLVIITVIGNATVILVILKDPCRNLQTVASTVFIFNLAVADLFLGLVIEPIYSVLLLVDVPLEDLDPISTTLSFAVEASCLTLVALAIQRWFVVEMPIRSRSIQTPRRLAVTIAVIWLMAGFIAGLPWFIKMQKRVYDYVLFDIVGPLLCITLLCVYGRIWILVRRSTSLRLKLTHKDAEKQPLIDEHLQTQAIRKERIHEAKVTRTFYIVCGAFIICWLPASLYVNIKGKDNTTGYGICLLAGLLNSALNPVIYSLRNERFKQATRKMFSRSSRSSGK